MSQEQVVETTESSVAEAITAHRREMRATISLALSALDHLHRGHTLTKGDELQIDGVFEMLHKAAWLCEICDSLDTKNYADKCGLFFDSLCDEHADLAEGPLWEGAHRGLASATATSSPPKNSRRSAAGENT